MKGFEDHDLRLTEIYHTEKSDAPSGTAITAEGNAKPIMINGIQNI
jgi:dihydrodipicolinate reductase